MRFFMRLALGLFVAGLVLATGALVFRSTEPGQPPANDSPYSGRVGSPAPSGSE